MIPLVAVIRVDRVRLWIPLFLVWLLLLPLLVLVLPLMVLVCLVSHINPFRALAAFWQVLSSCRGTNIEVNEANAAVRVRIF